MIERFPLVSCVMPTANRREFVPRAIKAFTEQDYPRKRLVILDDGVPCADLIPFGDKRISYYGVPSKAQTTLGQKRNRINSLAPGSLIMHWDDDDWYRSDRISLQVEALGDADICGLSRHLFYKPETEETWLYTYPETQRAWLAGGTCLYRRELWEKYPFPDEQIGSDTKWIWGWPIARLLTDEGWRQQGMNSRMPVNGKPQHFDPVEMVAIQDYGWYVATVHEGNTSKKIVQENEWKPWSGDIHALMSDKARVQIV